MGNRAFANGIRKMGPRVADVLEEEGGLDLDTQESPVCPRSRAWSAAATATVAWAMPPRSWGGEEAALRVERKRGPGP